MRKLALGIAAAVVVAGAVGYLLLIEPSRQFRQALDGAIATLPAGYKLTYAGARYSLISHRATLSGVALHVASSPERLFKINTLAVDHPNADFPDAWNRDQQNAATLKPDDVLPLAGKIAIDGFGFSDGADTATIGKLTVDNPRVYPWAFSRPGLPKLSEVRALIASMMQAQAEVEKQQKALVAQGSDAAPQPPVAPAQLLKPMLDAAQPLMRLEAAAGLGIGFDDAMLEDVAVAATLAEAGGTPENRLSFASRRIHESGYDRGNQGDTVAEGVTEEVGPTKVAMEHMEASGMIGRDLLQRLVEGQPLSLSLLDGFSIKQMEATGISASVPANPHAGMQRMYLSNVAFAKGFPLSGAFGMTGMKMSVTDIPDERARVAYQRMGINTLTLSIGIAYNWNADTQAASFRDVMFKIDELGGLTASVSLAHFGPDISATNPPLLAGATLRYDDASLVDRIVSGGATHTPAELTNMRQRIASVLQQRLAMFGNDPAVVQSGKALADFATTPHSLIITLAPPTPVAISDFASAGSGGLPQLVSRLGLSVAANR
jgi:hypothetical protein